MNTALILLQKHHLNDLCRIRNIYDVRKYLRQIKECTEESQLIWYESSKKDASRIDFVILHENKVVGSCIVRDIDLVRKHCEIGWFLDPEYQGRGIAYDACIKMLNFVFNDYQMETAYAFVYGDNARGISFAKKLKMKKVGELRNRRIRNNIPINEIIFDITREDFYA